MRRIFVIAFALFVVMASIFVYQEYRGRQLRQNALSLPVMRDEPRTVAATADDQESTHANVAVGRVNVDSSTDYRDHSAPFDAPADPFATEEEFCCEEEEAAASDGDEPSTWKSRTIKTLIDRHGDIPEIYGYVDLQLREARFEPMTLDERLELKRLSAMLYGGENIRTYEAWKRMVERANKHGVDVKVFQTRPGDPPPHESGELPTERLVHKPE